MQITEHFSLAELTVSEWAARNHVANQPSANELANLRKLAALLEEVRRLVKSPLHITSGFRSAKVNAAIGGSRSSAHMSGLAADFRAAGLGVKELCQAIANSSLSFDQLIYEFGEGGWCHLGLSNTGNRRQVLTKDATHDYTPGIH
jgi:zinc D-Ala-D-Ala carboxypeptidase